MFVNRISTVHRPGTSKSSSCQAKPVLIENTKLTSYWSKLNGDGEIVWGREFLQLSNCIDSLIKGNPSADPELTALGESQAVAAHEAWKSELEFGLPIPGRLYCSPLTRALHTYEITFDGILPDDKHPVVLEVKKTSHRPLHYLS